MKRLKFHNKIKEELRLKENLKYPKNFINKIICGDSIEVMKQMPDECLDLVVTSPPYNLKNSTGNGMKDGRGGKWAGAALVNGYSHYDDCMPHDEYEAWQRNCLAEMFRLIKEDGTIFYNHKWRVQDGLLQDRQNIQDQAHRLKTTRRPLCQQAKASRQFRKLTSKKPLPRYPASAGEVPGRRCRRRTSIHRPRLPQAAQSALPAPARGRRLRLPPESR